MTFGFYSRAHRTRLQEIVRPVGADGGRACTEYHAVLVLFLAKGRRTQRVTATDPGGNPKPHDIRIKDKAGWTRSEAFWKKAATKGSGNPAIRIAGILPALIKKSRSIVIRLILYEG